MSSDGVEEGDHVIKVLVDDKRTGSPVEYEIQLKVMPAAIIEDKTSEDGETDESPEVS